MACKSKEVVQVLDYLLSEDTDEIVMNARNSAAISQAIRFVKVVERIQSEVKQLYKDFNKQHDDYSDGLRKGLQCIESIIEEGV